MIELGEVTDPFDLGPRAAQQHITRRYDNPRAPLARQTFFLQPHLAWDWVAKPRLKEVYADTGFISFGPYLNASCTGDGSEKDSHGMSFPRISQIYAMFNGDLCPSTGFSVSLTRPRTSFSVPQLPPGLD